MLNKGNKKSVYSKKKVNSNIMQKKLPKGKGKELKLPIKSDSLLQKVIIKEKIYNNILIKPFSLETRKIINKIKNKKYKSIIVYPESLRNDNKVRVKKILQEFAAKGYLCFYCEASNGVFTITEQKKNFFYLNNDIFLLPLLRSKSVLVYITELEQLNFAKYLPFRVLLVDITKIEKFNKYNFSNAEIITVSNPKYSLYLPKNKVTLNLNEGKIMEGVNNLEKILKENPQFWKLFGNIEPNGQITVMTAAFLNYNGENFFSGGAERYLIDMSEVCANLGKSFVIYQKGNYPWVRRFQGFDVIALPQIVNDSTIFNRLFYENVEGRSLLNIYSAFFEAWPLAAKPNIGISHGVAWDKATNDYKTGELFWQKNRRFIEGAKKCEKIVSVDTNTANWFQTIDYKTSANISVIPNYVDLNLFVPRKNFDKLDDKIIILYPRRLYKPRGYYLVLEIIDDILKKFPQVEFHFVGKGIENDTKLLVEKKKHWKERIKWYSLSPEKMADAYQKADISIIPTIHSEGTSLSLLEAMSCGNAVIATRVGGLTDLVINDYNGYLIDSNANALKTAITDLLLNKVKLIEFKRKGIEVAKAFSKEKWVKEWTKIIRNKMLKESTAIQKNRLVEIYLDKNSLKEYPLGNLITLLLNNNDLLYIYVNGQNFSDAKSFGRIQWLLWNTEKYAKPDFIIADERIAEKIGDKAQLIINRLWLDNFNKKQNKFNTDLGIK